jgi:hypothetical protein
MSLIQKFPTANKADPEQHRAAYPDDKMDRSAPHFIVRRMLRY